MSVTVTRWLALAGGDWRADLWCGFFLVQASDHRTARQCLRSKRSEVRILSGAYRNTKPRNDLYVAGLPASRAPCPECFRWAAVASLCNVGVHGRPTHGPHFAPQTRGSDEGREPVPILQRGEK